MISALAPFIFFSILGIIVAMGVFFTLENKPMEVSEIPTSKLSRLAPTVWPYLVFASVLSLCSASLLQSIGFYLTDNFNNLEDITLLISFTFVLLSISTIVSQNMFTSMFNLNNFKLLIYGCLILTISYCVMALSDSIATYFSSIILHGVGLGMVRPANSSGLSIAQQPEYQGEAAGHLGSVLPIGHILTPIVAMPLYIYNSSLLYFASGILCFILFVFIVLHQYLNIDMKTKRGLLLINLGTPDDPGYLSVFKYLRQFLMDPKVITVPYFLRFILVSLIIVPFRAFSSGRIYKKYGLKMVLLS